MHEWDSIDNEQEAVEYGVSPAFEFMNASLNYHVDTSFNAGGLSLAMNNDVSHGCDRHGPVNSITIKTDVEQDAHPREVTVCTHCLMDMLVRECGAHDSDTQRRINTERQQLRYYEGAVMAREERI